MRRQNLKLRWPALVLGLTLKGLGLPATSAVAKSEGCEQMQWSLVPMTEWKRFSPSSDEQPRPGSRLLHPWAGSRK